MIRNDRQYRITKSQAEEFERSLAALAGAPPLGVTPGIHKAQVDALRSQLTELHEELAAYDALRDGRQQVLELTSLEELPKALIRARISAGITQRELADRLGLKEQQIQRYEATSYMSASLARINEIMNALGLKVRKEVYLPSIDTSFGAIAKRLEAVGLSREFVTRRLVPVDALEALDSQDSESTGGIGLRLSTVLNRIFGWIPSVVFDDQRALPLAPSLAVRFKLPANAESKRTLMHAVYTRYLATLVIQATPGVSPRSVPVDAREVRNEILRISGEITLRGCLEYAWRLGIGVLPLSESGGFHAATWRVSGRNIIVLKQTTRSEARWIQDFLHELRHAAEHPDVGEFEAIDTEVMSEQQRLSDEEQVATTFAGDVLLDGRAEELAEECVHQAGGRLQRLKTAVPAVAAREGVRTDALANYMAYRLALQGENWWGAATNLQKVDEDPWQVGRDFLIERLDVSRLDEVDRQLLVRALGST